MKRRELMWLLGGAATAWPLPVWAQQNVKVPRIGYLTDSGSINPAFRDRMRELGYFEGQNIAIELRGADFHLDRLPGLAAELAALPVDVIVTL